MTKATIEYGGGHLPPTVKAHIAKDQAQKPTPDVKTEFGGGHLPPTVKTHIAAQGKAE